VPAAPDAPDVVRVKEALPTEVLLSAVPPAEDGGMAVVGYRVEYEDGVQEFELGKWWDTGWSMRTGSMSLN